jgi:hypothetical protein
MSTINTSIQNGRLLRIGLLAVVAVIILAGAAYLWGNRLNADTVQANSQNSSAAPAARFGSSLGVSAVRAVEAAASRASHLNGVPAVRAVDQALPASSSLRVGGKTGGLSTLELQRATSQTQGLSSLELQRAKSLSQN